MKSIKNIVGINLLILIAYSAIIRLIAGTQESSGGSTFAILLMSAYVIGLHVFASFVIMSFHYFDKNKDMGNTWLLNSLVVLLVGFSACLGNAML